MKSLAMLYHGPVDLESYIYHYVNKQENQRYTANLDGNVCPIKAEDCRRNVETRTCSIFIPDSVNIS